MKIRYIFKTRSGKRYEAESKDADRARSKAKAEAIAAGDNWGGARLVGMTNSLR